MSQETTSGSGGYRTCLDEGGKCWMLLRNQPLPPGWFEFPMDLKSLGLHLEDIFRNRLEVQSQCTEENERQFYLQSHLAIYLLVKNELKELVRVLRYATWGAFFAEQVLLSETVAYRFECSLLLQGLGNKKGTEHMLSKLCDTYNIKFDKCEVTCKNQDAYSNFVNKMIVNYGCNNVKWL